MFYFEKVDLYPNFHLLHVSDIFIKNRLQNGKFICKKCLNMFEK